MIGNLISSQGDRQCNITVILHCDSVSLASTYGTRATLLSACDGDHASVEVWNASDPGIYAMAWQLLCNATVAVLG